MSEDKLADKECLDCFNRLNEKIRVLSGQLKSEQERVNVLSAALDLERVGEVVLGEGPVQQLNGNPCVGGIPVVRAVNKYLGKKGSLIFRPEVER